MRIESFRKILVTCVVLLALTLGAHAQQQGQGGGQQPPPTPQPSPQPQPRPTPTPTPSPQPSPTQDRGLYLRGRLIADAHTNFPQVEVRLETDGGQPVGFAYTNSEGEFTFQQSGVSFDQTFYVVVNVEGYKPHRERIDGMYGQAGFGGGTITIFLERELVKTSDRGGPVVVDLRQLRAKVPGKAVDEYEKALKESTKGNYSKAVDGLQRAIKLAPDFYEAQHTLGLQYIALQKYDDAENALLRARDLSPKASEPLINLGTLYYQRGERQSDAGQKDEAGATFQKSTEFLEESIRRNPLSAPAHSYLGAALYKVASYERAESTLQRALELDPELSDARLMLINVYTRQARYNDALEQADLFLAKNPKAPQRPAIESIKKQIENVLAQGK